MASEPVPGAIGLSVIEGFVGKLVWLLQAINGDLSKWTHAYMVLPDGWIFEAQPGGAVISPLSKYDGRETAYITRNLSPVQKGTIFREARSRVGTGYNWTTYGYLAAYRLDLPFLTRLLKRRVSRSDLLICSQAVDFLYQLAGEQLFDDGRLPFDVTPGDLARLLEEES